MRYLKQNPRGAGLVVAQLLCYAFAFAVIPNLPWGDQNDAAYLPKFVFLVRLMASLVAASLFLDALVLRRRPEKRTVVAVATALGVVTIPFVIRPTIIYGTLLFALMIAYIVFRNVLRHREGAAAKRLAESGIVIPRDDPFAPKR